MRVLVFSDADRAGAAAAAEIIAAFRDTPDGVLGVATGSTPEPLYARLRYAHATGALSLAAARAFALDEYVGLPAEHPQRYRNVLRAELVGDHRTGLRDTGLHTPDGLAADPHRAAADYDRDIRAAGGVDLQILGIGANGHIGFNEPGAATAGRTHVGALTEQTRRDNARFFGGELPRVPTHCITQGLGTICEARRILLLAFGARKAEAVRHLVAGEPTPAWPATVLQAHPSVTVFLDAAAAHSLGPDAAVEFVED